MTAKHNRTIADLGEHRLIAMITEAVKQSSQGDVAHIGDDAAILPASRTNASTVVSTDLLIEGVHWKPGHVTPQMLGRKALVVNLSDIAAMGAKPRWFTLGLALPPSQTVSWFRELLGGLLRAADEFRCPLIGGDLVRSPVPSISITIAGTPVAKRPVLRSGAKPGDRLFVTSDLGRARLALAALEGQEKITSGKSDILQKFQLPEPRLREAEVLTKCGVSAMMDVSDGLYSDVGWISEQSGVRIEIDLDRLPIHSAVRSHLVATGRDPGAWSALSGEEFELLFTSDQSLERLMRTFEWAGVKTPITEIGSVSSGGGVKWLKGGKRMKLEEDGAFHHFSQGMGPER